MRTLPLLAAGLLLANVAIAADWTQFHSDAQRTGAVSSDFAVPKERWWSQSTGGPIEASPVVSDGRVFVPSTDGKLYAFDAIAGSLLWTFEAGDPIRSTPALSGGILYLVSDSGKLFALDAVTGKKRLSAGVGSPDPGASRTSPAVHQGKLYVGTEDGRVIRYDMNQLTQDWVFSIGAEQALSPTAPTFNNQTGQWSGSCVARFAAKPIRSSPAVYNNIVFFGSDVHNLFAIDEFGLGGANAGKTSGKWPGTPAQGCPASWPTATIPPLPIYPEFGDNIAGAPAIDKQNNLVVVAALDNTIRAFDIANGAQRWNKTLGDYLTQPSNRSASTPAILDGKVYFGALNGKFYAVQSSTTSFSDLWSFSAGDAIWSSPAISNGLVAFGADDETIYVLDAATGAVKWSARTGGDVRSSPAIWTGGVAGTPIVGGVLYVGGADGILYAFGGEKPPLPDLRVENMSYPRDPLPLGADVEVNIVVRNGGNSTSPQTNLTFYIDGALVNTLQVISLPANGTANLTHVWRGVPASNHTLRAVVDPAGLSREFDRGNNELVSQTPAADTPPPPPPPPTNNTTPPSTTAPKKKSPGVELVGLAVAVGLVALLHRRRWP